MAAGVQDIISFDHNIKLLTDNGYYNEDYIFNDIVPALIAETSTFLAAGSDGKDGVIMILRKVDSGGLIWDYLHNVDELPEIPSNLAGFDAIVWFNDRLVATGVNKSGREVIINLHYNGDSWEWQDVYTGSGYVRLNDVVAR